MLKDITAGILCSREVVSCMVAGAMSRIKVLMDTKGPKLAIYSFFFFFSASGKLIPPSEADGGVPAPEHCILTAASRAIKIQASAALAN